jgi:hypothetical protein
VAYAIAGGITLPLVQWLSLYSNIGAMYYIWVVCLVSFFTAMLYRAKFEKQDLAVSAISTAQNSIKD